MMDALDQPIFDWVTRRVDELVDHCVSIEQARDARFLRRPQVLPPSAQRVLASCHELVKMLEERGDVTVPIKDDRVVMVRFGKREQDIDAEPDRCKRQAVDERVVGGVIGPEQKHALRAAAREHVELAW